MVLIGEFHEEEINGESFLMYHSVEYPSPEIHTQNSSTKVVLDELPLQPLFLCPIARNIDETLIDDAEDPEFFKKTTSSLYDGSRYDGIYHNVLPLFWCDNKEVHPFDCCWSCKSPNAIRTSYYYCDFCDTRYHKQCVECPLEIYHPSHFKLSFHLKHSLHLLFTRSETSLCILCGGRSAFLVYHCSLCDIYMHVVCAMSPILQLAHHKKFHKHVLTFFPRQDSLTCNICALVNQKDLIYLCCRCGFVAHKNCLKSPQIIRISRHPHRLSFAPSRPLDNWICGVCRKQVQHDYGGYACKVCSGYVVHTKCALRSDIWDGIDLEGVPEEEYENLEPFVREGDGVILHFLHAHRLTLRGFEVYDQHQLCQACGLGIYEDCFYACGECNFILHETCANAPRKKFYLLHPHQLVLEVGSFATLASQCHSCVRECNGFIYKCTNLDCSRRGYQVDVRCALISEPFSYQGHPHSLFLSSEQYEKSTCHVCKSTCLGSRGILNCIECEFLLCIECATLPYMVRYKHDDHYLTFCRGEEASNSDWCELCEGKLVTNGGKKGFYKCDDCCTTLHIDCILGYNPYLVTRKEKIKDVGIVDVRLNNSHTRKICCNCWRRCPYPTFFETEEYFVCSTVCIWW